jgi:hypothetical protein
VRKPYAAIRIIEHVSGTHVWVIGRYATEDAARHARNEAVEESAHHLTRHGGKGHVEVTPLEPLGIAVELVTPDDTIEASYLFKVARAPGSPAGTRA